MPPKTPSQSPGKQTELRDQGAGNAEEAGGRQLGWRRRCRGQAARVRPAQTSEAEKALLRETGPGEPTGERAAAAGSPTHASWPKGVLEPSAVLRDLKWILEGLLFVQMGKWRA